VAALRPAARARCTGFLIGALLFTQTAGAQPLEPVVSAAQVIARAQSSRVDVPRVELAAWLKAAGLQATLEYAVMRDNAARELKGRPDGVGGVTRAESMNADDAIGRQIAILQGTAQPPATLAEIARLPGRPQIPGLKIVYLNPLGDPNDANRWRNILAHQTEGPAGSARASALAQAANPTRRGVTLWVETDGTAYWATSESAIPTHGDGANRNDNKYIDNSKTFHMVVKTNTIGIEFVGNYPDVTKPVTQEQMQAWLVLVRFLQERYAIAAESIYAHNWIDYKDARYCEGCDLARAARQLAYQPSNQPRGAP
jgi:N-acetylmuramoyl-L-alanine amidase